MDDLAARVLGAISEAEAAEVHYEGCAVIRHGHAEVTCDCTATAALRRRCAAGRKIVALHKPTYPDGEPVYGVHWEHYHVRDSNGEIIKDREFCVENDEPDPPRWCKECAVGGSPCPTLLALAEGYGIEVSDG